MKNQKHFNSTLIAKYGEYALFVWMAALLGVSTLNDGKIMPIKRSADAGKGKVSAPVAQKNNNSNTVNYSQVTATSPMTKDNFKNAIQQLSAGKKIVFADTASEDAVKSKLEIPVSKYIKTPRDFDLLVATVQAEAGNQGEIGMRLACAVILNRIDSKKFKSSKDILSTISAKNQFSVWPHKVSSCLKRLRDDVKQAVIKELSNRSDTVHLYFNGVPFTKTDDVYMGHYFSPGTFSMLSIENDMVVSVGKRNGNTKAQTKTMAKDTNKIVTSDTMAYAIQKANQMTK